MGRLASAPRARVLLVLAVTVLALALRVHLLGEADIWWDEGYSAWLARLGATAIPVETAYDVHPPFYYLLLHWWFQVAGDGEFSLRFPSAFFGVLLVPLSYRLGRQLGLGAGAALAATFVAVSRFCVSWSQEARMYALAAALGLAGTCRAIAGLDRRGAFAAYTILTSLLLHTLYLGAIFMPLQALCLALVPERRGKLRRWALAQALVAASLVPWAALFLPRMRSWSVAEPTTLPRFAAQYWAAAVTGSAVHLERQAPVLLGSSLLFLLAVAAGLAEGRRGRLRRGLALFGLGLLPPAIVFFLAQPKPLFYSPRLEPRYLNPFAPFLYLLWAAGLEALARLCRPAGLLAGAASAGVLVLALPGAYAARVHSDRYSSLSCTLEAYRQPADLVVLHNDQDWPVFAYYFRGPWRGVPNAAQWEDAGAAGFLSPMLEGRQVVWLVTTEWALQRDPSRAIERHLRSWCGQSCHLTEWAFGPSRLTRFGRSSLPAPSLAPARRLPSGGHALAYCAGALRVRAGQRWDVSLWHEGSLPSVQLSCGGRPLEPAATWQEQAEAGRVVRTLYRFYPLQPGRCAFLLGEQQVLRVQVVPGAVPEAAAEVELQPLKAEFAGAVALEGYRLKGEGLVPGARLCLTLAWRSLRPLPVPYVVFVHLLGEQLNAAQGNFLWGQHDGQPAGGERPVPSWRPGERILDEHCFQVLPGAPAGQYLVEVGLYDGTTGERLPVTGGGEGDRIIVTSVSIGAP